MKKIIKLAALAVTIIGLTGCGANNDIETKNEDTASGYDTQSKETDVADTDTAQTKIPIKVATGGMPKPFSYVDENDEIKGYDIDVVRAIFERLPQYEVSFEVTEFTSIFAGLDSDFYQIGANNFALNKERQEKYIYTDPIFQNKYVIAVSEDNEDIHSFSDLSGKTTEVTAGTNYATALENYNKSNPDQPVDITYSETDLVQVIRHVEEGRYDFQLIDKAMLENYIDEFGLKIKVIELTAEDEERIATPYSYLILGKGSMGEQLEKDINETITQLKEDGTIAKISGDYFHEDYSPK
ncbi:MAG TPA: transporter substrate-binding domain-containing protein [Candidatus Merdenecus merdavium]|nr:transporter substrate-binding domain-containing protein [Candidatus Merdenecus merdavium]